MIFGLYESPITGQNSIHTRRAPNEALQYETWLLCPVEIGRNLPNRIIHEAQIEKWIRFPKATTKFNFKSGEEDVRRLTLEEESSLMPEPSNERAPLGQQQLQNMGT